MRGIRFPGRYIQGPGILASLGGHIAGLGDLALLVADPNVIRLMEADIEQGLGEAPPRYEFADHSGLCTAVEIDKLTAQGRELRANVVVGLGGGKTLDTAKSVAHALQVPVVIVPTIASSDAPCSALAVIYGEDGRVDHDQFLPNNPDLVFVDTHIIAKAPSRFMAAGIGDALATYYEAASCQISQAHNCMKMPGLDLAFVVAETCLKVIREHGREALDQSDQNRVGTALEKVVEANILMSGIGFESGGVATAHAIHHGLCELDDVHGALHGEKVAIGVLAALLIQDRRDEYDDVSSFCRSVGLPTRLADIGIHSPDKSKLDRVARRACRPGEIIHNEPEPVSEAQVVAALQALI